MIAGENIVMCMYGVVYRISFTNKHAIVRCFRFMCVVWGPSYGHTRILLVLHGLCDVGHGGGTLPLMVTLHLNLIVTVALPLTLIVHNLWC